MDPATISAGSQLLGAVGGLFGGKGPSNKDQYNRLVEQAAVSRADIAPRVQAYRDAGIHPLYGIAGQQFTPTPSGSTGDVSFGDKLSDFGQNVSRAAATYQTAEERAFVKVRDALTLDNMKAQNDLLRAQTTAIGAPSTPPFPSSSSLYPLDGQGNSGRLSGFEAGSTPDAGIAISRGGKPAIVPSSEIKNRIEDMIIPELQWYIRQVTSPPEGFRYNAFTGELTPVDKRFGHRSMPARVAKYIWNSLTR